MRWTFAAFGLMLCALLPAAAAASDGDVVLHPGVSLSTDSAIYVVNESMSMSGFMVPGDGRIYLDDCMVNMTPDNGVVDVTVCNLSSSYQRYNVSGSDGNGNLSVVAGGLSPSTTYEVWVDGKLMAYFVSSMDGLVAFQYSGNWSTHTFEVVEAAGESGYIVKKPFWQDPVILTGTGFGVIATILAAIRIAGGGGG